MARKRFKRKHSLWYLGEAIGKSVKLETMAILQRRKSVTATIGNVRVGSDSPVVVQSMTNTDTADIEGTILQVAQLSRAGSERVRVPVNNAARPKPCPRLLKAWKNRTFVFPSLATFITTAIFC